MSTLRTLLDGELPLLVPDAHDVLMGEFNELLGAHLNGALAERHGIVGGGQQ